jgi:fructose-bisphosphate aldolase class 1
VETRRSYREMIATTPALGESISGAILYDETIHQQKKDGTPFVKAITDAGIIPGIKVDTGAKDMAGHPGEKVTEGLDGLRERLAEYSKMGAHFAKWRAVIAVGDSIPSRGCIEANAHALARYAGLCQEAGLVPVVEPEVLMDGQHTLERCREVTEKVLRTVFSQLYTQRVALEGMILKPNMVVPGLTCPKQRGSVVDVWFEGNLPPIYSVLHTGEGGKNHHRGAGAERFTPRAWHCPDADPRTGSRHGGARHWRPAEDASGQGDSLAHVQRVWRGYRPGQGFAKR